MAKAGRKPPAKRAPIETLAIPPYTTMAMQGGTRMPMPQAAQTMAVARAGCSRIPSSPGS